MATRERKKNMLDPKIKQKIIKKYRTHEKDTGSTEVQVAILTEEIKLLTEHLKEHRQDFSSRRGLLKKVQQRRSLLQYLERENNESYEELVKKLKLKIVKKLQLKPEDLFEEEVINSEEETSDEEEVKKDKE